jgi:hypothetical protein
VVVAVRRQPDQLVAPRIQETVVLAERASRLSSLVQLTLPVERVAHLAIQTPPAPVRRQSILAMVVRVQMRQITLKRPKVVEHTAALEL